MTRSSDQPQGWYDRRNPHRPRDGEPAGSWGRGPWNRDHSVWVVVQTLQFSSEPAGKWLRESSTQVASLRLARDREASGAFGATLLCCYSCIWWYLVDIKSIDELREADERTLSFSPYGLGGKLPTEQAARFQQETIAQPDLAPGVPQRVRDCYDRLRTIHSYGVLCYDFFTVAHDQAQLALEFALRERFMEFHGDSAEFRDTEGNLHQLATTPFTELQSQIRKHEDDEWRLVIRRTGGSIPFDGMLDALLRWARAEDLLHGQRNRTRDRLFRDARDFIAHGAGDHLLMPTDSARAIHDIAEIINRLWGAATPGGRLYPASIRREVQLVGWSPSGAVMVSQVGVPGDGETLEPQAAVEEIQSAVPGPDPVDDWTWVLVRTAVHDEGLMRYDSLFEVTVYPCELLWGPGGIRDAVAWTEQERPQGDEIEVLDRLFLVQYDGDRLYLPRRPEVALGLDESERAGTWSLIRADSPIEAFMHARNTAVKGSGCSRKGACAQCAVETIRRGTWKEAAAALATERPECQPLRAPDARVTSMLRSPRYHRTLGEGNWILGDQ